MTQTFLRLSSAIILSTTLSLSSYIATLPDPTPVQIHLAQTCDTISISAAAYPFLTGIEVESE